MTQTINFENSYCPLPLVPKDQIVLGHGSGGRMTYNLIKDVFLQAFGNPILEAGNDFASVPLPQAAKSKGRLTISTDAHVITPIQFPGGDIGRLAVSGTVNDISMSGGIPLYLTVSFILEEGLSINLLKEIAFSMKRTAEEVEVQIIAGDTKVVEKGKADQIFITTCGIGWIPPGREISGDQAQEGDVVILSGEIAAHGIAVLAARGELKFQTTIVSDLAPLNQLVAVLLQAAPHTHVLRDPTRGGLATVLNEIAQQSRVGIKLDEEEIPIKKEVKSACEILGFDPLYVANEGKFVAILPKSERDAALKALSSHPLGKSARQIGIVDQENPSRVTMKTLIGGTRIVDMLGGEMLPRIC